MFIGNISIRNYFDKIIKADALSHAYLFYGPQGVGKKPFAFGISEAMAGPPHQTSDYRFAIHLDLRSLWCGGGPARNNPDLKIIDKGDEEIHIADIRELKNFIHLTPFGRYKIVIINNAHNLGRDASNALLKILEEPPGKSIFFLISHLPKLLLATITSRCQQIRFKPLKTSEILDYLINEKKIKKEAAGPAARLAKGSLGLALELANDFDNFQKNTNLLDKLVKADFKERFETAKKISASSEDLRKIVGDWFVYSASPPHSYMSSGGSLPDKKLSRELLHLNNMLSRPQFNHRLALDNFLINL